jgi:membrane protein required for colicin V production
MNLSLNLLDIVLMVILAISIVLGLIKGFIRELFSLAFFIIAVVLSFLYYFETGNLFLAQLRNRDLANFVGFILIFALVVIVGAVVTWAIKKIFVVGPLKSVDRMLGGVFGLVRGILVSAIIVFGLVVFPVDDRLVVESRFSPYVLRTIGIFLDVLPEKFKERFHLYEREDEQINHRTGRTV